MAEGPDKDFIVPQEEPEKGTFDHWLWSLHTTGLPVVAWGIAETPQGQVSGLLSYEEVEGKKTYCWNREPIDEKLAIGIIGTTSREIRQLRGGL